MSTETKPFDAAQFAADQRSDDRSDDWNAACIHIAEGIHRHTVPSDGAIYAAHSKRAFRYVPSPEARAAIKSIEENARTAVHRAQASMNAAVRCPPGYRPATMEEGFEEPGCVPIDRYGAEPPALASPSPTPGTELRAKLEQIGGVAHRAITRRDRKLTITDYRDVLSMIVSAAWAATDPRVEGGGDDASTPALSEGEIIERCARIAEGLWREVNEVACARIAAAIRTQLNPESKDKGNG